MGILGKAIRVFIFVAIMVAYLAVLWMGFTEENRRSLTIVNSSAGSDSVMINVRVTSIDTAQRVLHERIRLVPMGRFAIDKTTPATDLKLLVNTVSGKQAVVFPKGERIVPIDCATFLTGNQNRYPFDAYTTELDLLVTAPAEQAAPPAALPEEKIEDNDDSPMASTLIVGASDLSHSESVPIKENFTASIAGSDKWSTSRKRESSPN